MRNYSFNQGALLPLESSDKLTIKSDQYFEMCRFARCIKFEYIDDKVTRTIQFFESTLFFIPDLDLYFWADIEKGTIEELTNNPSNWTFAQEQQLDDYLIEKHKEHEEYMEKGEGYYEELAEAHNREEATFLEYYCDFSVNKF